MIPTWPYLTADVPAIAAAIKRRYEDFVVEEIPLYEPCGSGEHVYVRIEKTGLATMRAVHDIARALGVAPHAIGVAGLKDARAVARQTLSIQLADPARVAALDIPRIRVLSVDRHGNKLRIGHLRGNRFIIKLREIALDRADDVRALIDVMSRRGVPNYFGAQRFGLRGDTWAVGKALLAGDEDAAAALIAGRAGPHDHGDVLRARRLYDEGRYEEAARAWPYGFRDAVRVCGVMAKTGGKARRAVRSLDRRTLEFFVSAYQSWLFNNVLALRLPSFDRVQSGDLAYKHDNGAIFRVEDAEVEQPRAERFEISPTGPLYGPRMTRPGGEPDAVERRVLADAASKDEDFAQPGPLCCAGGRRPLRFQPRECAVEVGGDDAGPFVELRFELPAGCYATCILCEIAKERLEEGLADDGD